MTRKAGVVLCFLSLFLLASCATREGYALYDATGDRKAMGLSFSVAYPKDWNRQDDCKPASIVQTFWQEKGAAVQHLIVQITDMDADEAATMFGDEAGFEASGRKAAWMNALGAIEGATLLDVRAATHRGAPAVISDMAISRPRDGRLPYTREWMMMVYYRERMVSLVCGVAAEAVMRDGVDRLFEENRQTVCRYYFDSLEFRE